MIILRQIDYKKVEASKKCKHQWKYEGSIRTCTECGIRVCEHKWKLSEDRSEYICEICSTPKCNHKWKERNSVQTTNGNGSLIAYKYIYVCEHCKATRTEEVYV